MVFGACAVGHVSDEIKCSSQQSTVPEGYIRGVRDHSAPDDGSKYADTCE